MRTLSRNPLRVSLQHLLTATRNPYCELESPPADSPALRFHGERIIAAPAPAGAALRIGSTPEISLMAVGTEDEVPSVVTTITASPLFKSETEIPGIRLSIC